MSNVPPKPPAVPDPSTPDQPFRFPRQYRPGQEPPEPVIPLPPPTGGRSSSPVSSWLPPAPLPSPEGPPTGPIETPEHARRRNSWVLRHRLLVVLLAGCLAMGVLAGVAAAITPV